MRAFELSTGAVVPLTGDRLSIGRDRSCHISLSRPTASRRHALLVREGLRLALTDCGCANGTKVNGLRLRRARQLSYGDSIEIGAYKRQVVLLPTGLGRDGR
jgi:pSer/pThr/pTyr-binding forkhead associated (FHA) protein